MALAVDRYTPAEMRALDAVKQIGILDELFGEMKHLADLKSEASDLHYEARAQAQDEGRKPGTCSRVTRAKKSLDRLTIMIGARKIQVSILQTLLRSIPA
jgi:hypothetical protein